mmetsp:Transcript_10628/g.25264  ORF Transcript_10628/g.25264 Transcript_10628/m.25264 type:complete len:287 (+) Transcript_10628:67-927(+)
MFSSKNLQFVHGLVYTPSGYEQTTLVSCTSDALPRSILCACDRDIVPDALHHNGGVIELSSEAVRDSRLHPVARKRAQIVRVHSTAMRSLCDPARRALQSCRVFVRLSDSEQRKVFMLPHIVPHAIGSAHDGVARVHIEDAVVSIRRDVSGARADLARVVEAELLFDSGEHDFVLADNTEAGIAEVQDVELAVGEQKRQACGAGPLDPQIVDIVEGALKDAQQRPLILDNEFAPRLDHARTLLERLPIMPSIELDADPLRQCPRILSRIHAHRRPAPDTIQHSCQR